MQGKESCLVVIRSSNPFASVGHVRAPACVSKQWINASELINAAEPVQECLHPIQALEISESLQAEAPACPRARILRGSDSQTLHVFTH